MNMPFRRAVAALSALALAGCATTIPLIEAAQELPAQRPLTFVFPPQLQPSSGAELIRKLKVDSYRRTGEDYYIDGLRREISAADCFIERYRGYLHANGRESREQKFVYDCKIQEIAGEKAPSATLNFHRLRTLTGTDGRAVKMNKEITFTVDNAKALLLSAKLPVTIEVDSEFTTDSTYANFVRLARRESISGDGSRDEVTGKIFKDRFSTKIDGKDIVFHVETFPYRNGSKAIVYATIQGVIKGDTVDFSQAYNAVRKAVERIVKS